ncbi:MAG: thiamine biosynthesis protein ThiH [Deltaproteobacteria bacterium RIFCSPLOWO2_12_FULL_44_12]|nr:MAG: thiamine biosynthesis protein ThiH [Deltaproteobacteria bacterium RIFCSPHIGHO2_01_FULL_43_49]OGQ15646.1 MAG: thiamine biosynthesis protein ThiH [Deltaproteobacteria bacterium RIFCSPHIGHO2_02_FULL_44_53]OGQ28615.1 MAG: thiamine biosynthesis protein ThiH [Deltaproteobacteria bacterium RIFCSPHIGHO2_12_FULL_44_21]OGQ31937.1 MAG: thiamine biosynthesis protein ThiH [Deltaproteobacteria bacterium RIFCSPLOWO2_01_FULL_45_74]OGQ43553.1 MAG: thiamine biosynthesis protein ThiH [Deltaproteobacteria 
MESLKEKVHRLTVQRFGKTIQLFAPLYLSNECVDTCLYCGFSRHNKIERKTLSVTEVLEEAKILINQGFKHLLLVSGEHPKKVSVDYLSEIARTLRPKIASLSIEVAPLDEQSYQRLALYGVDGVVIYQETYDKEVYNQVHIAGPKKDYAKRLSAVEEACKAGIRQVGIGVLLGLSPWQKEIQRLIEHAKYLMKRYWQTEFRISLPRLKPCASSFQAPYPVSDEEFAHIIMMLRVALPELGLVLSTREKPELRDQLIYLGVTHMSAGSKTEPGGYAHPEEAGKQFDIEDLRTPAEVARAITKAGYEPVWKDWI